MSMLYVWHPTIVGDGDVVQAMITRGDSDQVGEGSKQFVESLLQAVGVSAAAKTWKIESFRSNFYSEYWQEGDWQSRWDFVWRCRIKVQEPVAKLKNLHYLGIDEIDDPSARAEEYKKPPYRCLVIAQLASERRAGEVAELISGSEVPAGKKGAKGKPPKPEIFRITGRKFHLHVDLGSGGEAFFSAAESYPETIAALCEKHGALIHVEQ